MTIAAQFERCQECGAESGFDDVGRWEDQPHDMACPNRRPTDEPIRIHNLG